MSWFISLAIHVIASIFELLIGACDVKSHYLPVVMNHLSLSIQFFLIDYNLSVPQNSENLPHHLKEDSWQACGSRGSPW